MTITEEDLKCNPKLAALVQKAESRDLKIVEKVAGQKFENNKAFMYYSAKQYDDSGLYIFDITPIGKPRMTRRDKWAKTRTKQANKYMVFRNQLEWLLKEQNFELGYGIKIIFLLPFKKNWSKGQCELMRGQPHLEKPDADNMLKAFIDVACKRDEKVYNKDVHKFWWDRGLIVVMRNEPEYTHLSQITRAYDALQGFKK